MTYKRYVILRLILILFILLTVLLGLANAKAALAPLPPWETTGRTESTWGMVNANDVNFRSGAGLKHRPLYSWSYGHCVEILSKSGEWYEVWDWITDCTAWVFEDYLTIVHQ